ncbi:uncharacterized protein I303_103475 [Kwoniella dejecticola CBS 10117]|uniref:Uncharacterized protein n=1 Tax=Kwoniella dejecticola CBS 10117 TaxID=1296121 RepID=A0A1A6A6U8_9TREE|nr:uncharacterized protein I303_03497 [Kwoniella dejecticola CBS 10117]OBR85785.1 hypothetical protein I303_03497 [Kwoniella dejecticola CBS 10117]
MSGLAKLITAIAPPPAKPLSRDYDGFEFRWKMFAFRPAEFKFEASVLGIVGIYLAIYLIGKVVNSSRARSSIKPYESLLAHQFSSVRALLASSPSLWLLYATGRRNLLSLHVTVSLLPIHDLAGLVIHFVKSIIEPTYDGSENINFDFTLGRGEYGLQGEGLGVWGIVDKSALRETREKRWDLTFAKLNDSASGIPITHALFTEHVEITDLLLKTPNIGISDVLNTTEAASVLKYLLISDVPQNRPSKGPLSAQSKSRHVILSVYKPSSPAQEDAVKAWIQVTLNIVDLVNKQGLLKPDISRKLIKTRQTVDSDLGQAYKKEQDEDKEPEETPEERRAAKKKAEREKLSDKERKKLEDLEKKREMRKMQKKQALGGAGAGGGR